MFKAVDYDVLMCNSDKRCPWVGLLVSSCKRVFVMVSLVVSFVLDELGGASGPSYMHCSLICVQICQTAS